MRDAGIDFNTFNIDLIYTWNFAPGSLMNFMRKNSIYNSDVGSGITDRVSFPIFFIHVVCHKQITYQSKFLTILTTNI